MIDILVPVWGRPHRVRPLLNSIQSTTTVPYCVIFLCTFTDEEQLKACLAVTSKNVCVAMLDIWAPGDYAKKINLGYAIGEAEFIFLGADDLLFQPGWDTEALKVEGKGVIGTNDDANPTVKAGKHSTHPLVRRSYIEEYGGGWDGPGIVYSEAYSHQWCDTELVTAAKQRNQWAFAADSHVTHLHPFYDKTVPTDATYERGLSTSKADRAIYQQRLRQSQR